MLSYTHTKHIYATSHFPTLLVLQVCAKIFEHGIVPPTTNLDNPDLEAGCDLDYTPNVAYTFPDGQRPRAIISDNLGFGEC